MTDKPENPPAFPSVSIDRNWNNGEPMYTEGMTLRDYFAGQALQCVQGSYGTMDFDNTEHDRKTHAFIAKHAYGIADAMLKARQS